MKYIKLFEGTRTAELKKFCKDNLAYLIDDGFKVRIDKLSISIRKENGSYLKSINFNWFDVRDDIIPFIIMLKDRYNIKTIFFVTSKFNKKTVSYSRSHINIKVEDIIEDKLENIKFLETLCVDVDHIYLDK